MASLITQLAKCLRRYNADEMSILAEILEEREFHESARKIRIGEKDTLIAYVELQDILRRVRKHTAKAYDYNIERRYKHWRDGTILYGKDRVDVGRYRVIPDPGVNLRDTPSRNGRIIRGLIRNTLIRVHNIVDGWAVVRSDSGSIEGYVEARWLEMTPPPVVYSSEPTAHAHRVTR